MGRLDVDAMADELPLELIHEWRAYLDVIAPDDWRQAGTIAAEVWNLREVVMAALSKEHQVKQTEALDFAPILRAAEELEELEHQPAAEFERRVAALFQFPTPAPRE